MSNYVTVTAEVEFDMEDYIDDILEKLSDEELIEELEDREFVVYETAPLLQIEFNNPTDLKRHLCDIANAGYCISNEELINEREFEIIF
jgi:hypothetical protein